MYNKMKNKQLKLTDQRSSYRPFQYPWAFDFWLKHEQSHWLHSEVPMLEDVKDWKKKLTPQEREFLTNIFRFFTQGDIDVAGGYVHTYLPNFPQPEVRMMLMGFAAREAVHIASYSHLIETLGLPEATYNQFLEYQEMKDKHEYITNLVSENKNDLESIAERIAVFSAFTEGMQLFSSFVMLLNFPRNGLMRGMGQIIQWAIIDETAHCEGMIKLFRTFIHENPEIWNDSLKGKIYSVAEKMVDLEDKFIDLSFAGNDMRGLTSDEVKKYIRYICDRRLISLGLKGIFKVKRNPIPWVEEQINAPGHTNFFENKSGGWGRGAVTGTWDSVWAK